MGKGGFWVTSFIYKYKTSTTYPLYEIRDICTNKKWHLWVQSALATIHAYPQSGYDQKIAKIEIQNYSQL